MVFYMQILTTEYARPLKAYVCRYCKDLSSIASVEELCTSGDYYSDVKTEGNNIDFPWFQIFKNHGIK